MHLDTDIVVSGAGPAGLALACALGAEGLRVAVMDPRPPVVDGGDARADLRSTAVLSPGRAVLERAGAWDALDADAEPLAVMRILDAGRTPPVARDFRATDLGADAFGWNLPNWAIRRALLSRAEALETVELRFGTAFEGMLARDGSVRVRLDDGTRLSAALLVGCDGRDSPVRAAAGIAAPTTEYGQTAAAFVVAHDAPHGGVSTEVYREGGAFTLVPMPDRDGTHRSAVVWMDRAAGHARRAMLDDAAFGAEATERSADANGALRVISRRALWPIVTRIATAMTARRVALAAEAAHAMPPIGAQGLNTSLADVAALRDLAVAHCDALGDRAMLDAYARARQADVAARAVAVDALNRVALSGAGQVQALRAGVMSALHGAGPVRRALMRAGLGRSAA